MVLLLAVMAWSLVVNEVCYDPTGPDGGAEFVEIYNAGDAPASLSGARLEFANGSGQVAWAVRWRGEAGDVVPPRGFFLIVDTGWTGAPGDAEVGLGLQNGPDALRLVRPDSTFDTLGWGDLAAPELFEGTPAPDVSGLSLVRRPDGRDTDHNLADWQPAAPSPGRSNWPAFQPLIASWSWQPPVLAGAGRPLEIRLAIHNAGRADLAGDSLRVGVGATFADLGLPAIAPEATDTVTVSLAPGEDGVLEVRASMWARTAGDTATVALGRVQVGPADVQLAEVMAAPAAGGEWCEIVNNGAVPRSLAGLQVRDEDGAWRGLPDLVLAPGDCRVLAQDADALASWLDELSAAGLAPDCRPAPPLSLDGWPSLNNSAPASRAFADRLYLGLADGTVTDFVTLGLGSGEAPQGRSFERQADRSWRPATAPAGATPGCSPPAAPIVAPGEVRLAPNPFARDGGTGVVHAYLDIPPGAAGFEMRIYDLWGRLVRDLGGDDLGPGARDLVWDGRDDDGEDLAVGGYVAVVLWRDAAGLARLAARRLVVLREAGP